MNAFESGILWRDSALVIPNNRQVAEAYLWALGKRLEREPALKSAYDASIVCDVANGYIRKMISCTIRSETQRSQERFDGCKMLPQSVKESAWMTLFYAVQTCWVLCLEYLSAFEKD